MSHSRSERKGVTRRNWREECAGRGDEPLSLSKKVAGNARSRTVGLVQSAGNVGIDRQANSPLDHPAERTVVVVTAARIVSASTGSTIAVDEGCGSQFLVRWDP
jgi:hypothetical protein